jgi:hypothetical protein
MKKQELIDAHLLAFAVEGQQLNWVSWAGDSK